MNQVTLQRIFYAALVILALALLTGMFGEQDVTMDGAASMLAAEIATKAGQYI